MDKIAELEPNLIICDKEENTQKEVEQLMKHHKVWVSDTNNLEQGLEMIKLLGEVTGKMEKASSLIKDISQGFDDLAKQIKGEIKRTAVYLIWNDPMMVAGKGTFINDMMEKCGLDNQFLFNENGYPKVTLAQLHEANPDLILLSSEPFPFTEKHLSSYQKMLPNADIILADGEMFSWPASRMKKAAAYFNMLINSTQFNRQA